MIVKSLEESRKVQLEQILKLRDGEIDIKTSRIITKLTGKLTKLHGALLKSEIQGDLEKMTQIRTDGELLSNQLDEAISESKTT